MIQGQRGCGKTTLAQELIKNNNRLFIFDTLGEYEGSGVLFYEYSGVLDFWAKHHNDNFRIIFCPLNPNLVFPDICDLVYECGNMTFLVEEIDSFLTSAMPEYFLNIVQRGRHKNIELIGITQRPYTIPPLLRSQCKVLYSFCQREQRDIDWLKSFIGNDGEKIKNLKNFQYIIWENGHIEQKTTKKI